MFLQKRAGIVKAVHVKKAPVVAKPVEKPVAAAPAKKEKAAKKWDCLEYKFK